MPETFLHGVELLEIGDGARPIRSVRSSVIGLVGSGLSDGVAASVEIGALNAKLKFTSKTEGAAGNEISIVAVNPGTNNAALSVSVVGKVITVSLATDGSAAATSTAAQVRTAINASTPAAALVTCDLGSGSSGATVYAAHTSTPLANGVSPSFPLDRPVLVTNGNGLDAKVGADSYLGKSLEKIYRQAGAVVVVIRTDDVEGDATEKTGAFALLRAQADLGVTPRILLAEGGSDVDNIGSLKSVAASLRAIVVVGIEVAAATDATGWIEDNGNERVYGIWPFVNGGEDPAPYAAGLIAKSDNDRGFWWSPSNQEIFGITSLDYPVDFQMGDTTSLANVLNEGKVATFIREGGFRLWGNLTGSTDPKWAFLSVRRTADIINDSIRKNHLWAVDRPITRFFFEDVAENVSAYMRDLKNQGAILGGKCWPSPDLNSISNIPLGKAFFDFDFTPTYPAQTITFRSMLVNDYLEDLVTA